MKRNTFAAYDFMRQNKFIVPDKIKMVESILESDRVVVNWWCRQSGKTLTNVKIARDLVVNNPGSSVLVICPRGSIAKNFVYVTGRSIELNLIDTSSTFFIKLKNGSIIQACTYNSDTEFTDKDLVIVDEFDFIEIEKMAEIIIKIKRETEPTFLQRIVDLLDFQKNRNMKFILSSSKYDRSIFELIKNSLKRYYVTYLNWEKLSIEKDKIDNLKKMLGDESFKDEYDSYKPE